MKLIKSIWNITGSIYITSILFLIAIIDLIMGYYKLKFYPYIFTPLNDIGFIKWTQTYGKSNLIHTSWLFILIFLLALISINTFVCTTERVVMLFKNQSAFTKKTKFILKLAPHIIHYALLIMLLGYLVSYLSAETHLSNILLPGKSIKIQGSSSIIHLDKLNIDYYNENRLAYMQDRAVNVDAQITIKSKNKVKTANLSFNKPVWFAPYSIHLKSFAPKSNSGMKRRSFIDVIIKKDPGVKYYFSGIAIFITGLFIYLWQWLPQYNKKEED